MAVKITRQPKNIVLIGAPSSAGAHSAGCEEAPAALRAAGIAARLEKLGFEVSDAGDIAAQVFQADDDSPRARNVRPTVKSLEALQPLVEKAVKSGALPVILGGDCTITMAALAGIRRYYKEVSLIYCDGDADLNTPATTPSGFFDGMVVAHITGQGAPELVRFYKEPPLVREPDIALFGLQRLDPPEREWLDRSPMRRFTPEEIREAGPAAAAQAALERIHTFNRQWTLHFDVDVLASDEFAPSEFGAPTGLKLAEMQAALEVFLSHPNLAAVVITEYLPAKDSGGAAAARLLEMFAAGFAARYQKLVVAAEAEAAEAEKKEAEEGKEGQEAKEVEEVKEASAGAPEPPAPVEATEQKETAAAPEAPAAESPAEPAAAPEAPAEPAAAPPEERQATAAAPSTEPGPAESNTGDPAPASAQESEAAPSEPSNEEK